MGPGNRRIRVLVADDSRTALLSVCRYLEFEGKFEVLGTAADGLDLLQKAKALRPDLVLTDLSMPRISGLEATMELRKSFPELRILIFTELNGISLRDECLRCGADGFVEKSQMPEKLMEEVQRLFSRHP
ncbi:MAG TPA: response regulator transcription factor [Candidatus Binatus sp.]|nr:response regulator transcription factor [Candidatus Binatus sp.]